jgi:hypothetical protein
MINEASAREARKKPVVRESTSGTAQLFRRTKRYKPLAFLYHTGASTPSRLRTLAENQLRNVKIEAPPRKRTGTFDPTGERGQNRTIDEASPRKKNSHVRPQRERKVKIEG